MAVKDREPSFWERRLTRRVSGAVLGVVFVALGRLFGLIGVALALMVSVAVFAAIEIMLGRRGEKRERIEGRRGFWVGLILPLGLLLLFTSERIIGSAHEQIWTWRSLALVALAGAAGWRIYSLVKSKGNQRKVETWLSIATGGVLISLVIYALGTDAGIEWMGLEESAAERTGGVLAALFPATLVVSLTTLFYMELAYRLMPIEEAIELRRVSAAAGTGLAISLSLVFVGAINFVASERDVKRDLSYFRTTEPSETTLRMVADIDEPVEVHLFYPDVNEVLDALRPYFEALDAQSDQLTVVQHDHALAAELAREHQVRGNGFVLITRGEGEGQQAESFEVGLELETARRRLRTLDGLFQQHFAQLTRRPRELYLTTGHRERSASPLEGDPREQRLGELIDALSRSNIQHRDLGPAQGLGNRVPEGAPAVAVVGPREPFLPEEAQSLVDYVGSGGRLLVFVDPGVDHGLDPLLAKLGLRLRDGVLHSERSFVRRGAPPANRQIIYSNTYSAHPTVTLANRFRSRVASVFMAGGALERSEQDMLEGANVTFPLRASSGYWLDLDGDHEQDAGEPSQSFNMMAAVTVPASGDGEEGRAVVVADGDFITDAWISNRGNAFVLMDAVNWLVGEEQILGPTQSEEDRPIEIRSEDDAIWFYGTAFGLPLPLLIVGFWLQSRRRRGGDGGESDEDEGEGEAEGASAEPAPAREEEE